MGAIIGCSLSRLCLNSTVCKIFALKLTEKQVFITGTVEIITGKSQSFHITQDITEIISTSLAKGGGTSRFEYTSPYPQASKIVLIRRPIMPSRCGRDGNSKEESSASASDFVTEKVARDRSLAGRLNLNQVRS